MKSHIGADLDSGLVHTVVSTAANVSDISQAAVLLHGSEAQVHADAGNIGVKKRAEVKDADPAGRIDWQVARKRIAVHGMEEGPEKEQLKEDEHHKSSLRSRVSIHSTF